MGTTAWSSRFDIEVSSYEEGDGICQLRTIKVTRPSNTRRRHRLNCPNAPREILGNPVKISKPARQAPNAQLGEASLKFFHFAPMRLGPGSIVEPGNFGRVIRATQHAIQGGEASLISGYVGRELIFELVRAKSFPTTKPSRLTSALTRDRSPRQIVLQEGAPVSVANAMKRSMYSVASVGHHNPCWMDCFKALPTCLCSIFRNIST